MILLLLKKKRKFYKRRARCSELSGKCFYRNILLPRHCQWTFSANFNFIYILPRAYS